MLVYKGQPNKSGYIWNALGSYFVGCFMLVFTVLWFSFMTNGLYDKYMVNKGSTEDYVIYIIGIIVCTVVFISLGSSLSFRLYKKRCKELPYIKYEINDECINVITFESTKRLRFEDIKGVVVVISWVYSNKGIGDIYFKKSKEEIITFGTKFIITSRNLPKAMGFIAINDPEEVAKKVVSIINEKCKVDLVYSVINKFI